VRDQAHGLSHYDSQPADVVTDWHDLAHRQGILNHCKFRHEFVRGQWNSEVSCWDLSVRDLDNQVGSGSFTVVKYDILVVASGALSTPKMPDIEGLDKFQGQMVHTSHWPQHLTPDKLKGKTVMVVGNGCSGWVMHMPSSTSLY
jgi:4-hydroxyacetophenone monooxygenase